MPGPSQKNIMTMLKKRSSGDIRVLVLDDTLILDDTLVLLKNFAHAAHQLLTLYTNTHEEEISWLNDVSKFGLIPLDKEILGKVKRTVDILITDMGKGALKDCEIKNEVVVPL